MSPARMPGMVVTDHTFSLPLDHAEPNDETIEVFAREVVAPGRENEKLPFLVFLQRNCASTWLANGCKAVAI